MKRQSPPAPRLKKRYFVVVGVLTIFAFVVVVQGPTWYRIWAGAQEGTFSTLEADIAAQRQVIDNLLENALGDYQILGERVSVDACYLHEDEHNSGTMVIVRPIAVSAQEGAEAMAAELERSGLRVETKTIVNDPLYSAEIDGFPLSLWFQFSDGPDPGIEVHLAGECYTADQVETADPRELSTERGIGFLRRD